MSVYIRECDDWVALYKDGEKVQEGHSLRAEDVLTALGVEFKSEWIEIDDIGRALDGSDPFPDRLPCPR